MKKIKRKKEKKEMSNWVGCLLFSTSIIGACFVSVIFDTSTWFDMLFYKFFTSVGF